MDLVSMHTGRFGANNKKKRAKHMYSTVLIQYYSTSSLMYVPCGLGLAENRGARARGKKCTRAASEEVALVCCLSVQD